MSDITLNIELNHEGLKYFTDSNEQIVIIRPNPDKNFDVACVVFSPFGENNTVKFSEQWFAYASNVPVENMTEIKFGAKQKTNTGKTNIFIDSGFSNDSKTCPSNYFGISNQRSIHSPITIGLAQKISINDAEDRLFASYVDSLAVNQTDFFLHSPIVLILTASSIKSNMIISSSMLNPSKYSKATSIITVGDYLKINLDNTTKVYFDEKTNLFRTGSLP